MQRPGGKSVESCPRGGIHGEIPDKAKAERIRAWAEEKWETTLDDVCRTNPEWATASQDEKINLIARFAPAPVAQIASATKLAPDVIKYVRKFLIWNGLLFCASKYDFWQVLEYYMCSLPEVVSIEVVVYALEDWATRLVDQENKTWSKWAYSELQVARQIKVRKDAFLKTQKANSRMARLPETIREAPYAFLGQSRVPHKKADEYLNDAAQAEEDRFLETGK